MSCETTRSPIGVRSNGKFIMNGGSSLKTPKSTANGKRKLNNQYFHSLIKSLEFKVLPADEVWTCEKQKPVKLRCPTDQSASSSSSSTSSSSSSSASSSITVMTAFVSTVERFGTHTALATKVDGKWKTWTFEEYFDDVICAAKSLISIGMQPFDGVGIIGFNSPEWFIADIGAIFAGGLATGFYTTNSAETCKFVALNAECSVIIVENDSQLQKILSIRAQLPKLKAIVQYKGTIKANYDNVYTWEAFMKLGEGVPDEELKSRIERQHCNQCCTLIYTSGTTGNPKGVMLSHDNLTWSTMRAAKKIALREGAEVILSYLPLSHIAAQVLDIFLPLVCGLSVYFAQPDAMKGSLGDSLKEVRPTMFLGVPRVWEKMAEKITACNRKNGRVKRSLLQWSRQIGLKGNLSMMNGGRTPLGWSLAEQLVFRKVRSALGFDRCRLCFSAAAPIMKDTLEVFASINIPIMEVFGMSETSGPHTISVPWKWRLSSVGQADDLCPITISNPTHDDGDGEVCMDGRNIFMGYLNELEKTKETLDEMFRLRSGDLGKTDADGFVHITGRIKELIITAGGENVAPVPIEDAVREALSSCLSNCMVIGDKQRFLSILITLKTEVDSTTFQPKDRLTPAVVQWCQSLGSHLTSVSEVIAKVNSGEPDPLFDAIQAGIDRANQKAVSRAQTIQKWSILPRDFSIPSGELGPTLKLKRHVVTQLYAPTIESLYSEQVKQ